MEEVIGLAVIFICSIKYSTNACLIYQIQQKSIKYSKKLCAMVFHMDFSIFEGKHPCDREATFY